MSVRDKSMEQIRIPLCNAEVGTTLIKVRTSGFSQYNAVSRPSLANSNIIFRARSSNSTSVLFDLQDRLVAAFVCFPVVHTVNLVQCYDKCAFRFATYLTIQGLRFQPMHDVHNKNSHIAQR